MTPRDDAIEAIKERLNSTYADEDTWQQVMAEAALDGLLGWLREDKPGLVNRKVAVLLDLLSEGSS